MLTPAAMPDIKLGEIGILPIDSSLNIGRAPASSIPAMINEAMGDSDPANMYMRMYYLMQALGQRELALGMQAKALERRCTYRIAEPGTPAIRLLAIMAPGDMMDNAPLEYIVDNSDIRLDLLFLLPDQTLPGLIPDHDVAIIAVSQSDKHLPLLARLGALASAWPRPVLNHPYRIVNCARDAAYRLLNDIPGLLIPETRRIERAQALQAWEFPLTIRPIDTHGGKGLARLADAAEARAYVAARPEREFYVAAYVDYRSEDGLFRKFRVALIDGKPYICHLAISEDWIVHYINADMRISARKRAEEAALMGSFDSDFAARHRSAFSAIADRFGLDYVILDCGEMRDGRLVLFEADVGGWIHSTDPADIFPYKPKVMQKAFDAFRNMLAKRMTST
jgi:hypothetical protein